MTPRLFQPRGTMLITATLCLIRAKASNGVERLSLARVIQAFESRHSKPKTFSRVGPAPALQQEIALAIYS